MTPEIIQMKFKKWINKHTNAFKFTTNTEVATFEIPLVFLHEKYPSNGQKLLRLNDKKYLKVAEAMQKNKTLTHLGYIYIFDTKDAHELPKVMWLSLLFLWKLNSR